MYSKCMLETFQFPPGPCPKYCAAQTSANTFFSKMSRLSHAHTQRGDRSSYRNPTTNFVAAAAFWAIGGGIATAAGARPTLQFIFYKNRFYSF